MSARHQLRSDTAEDHAHVDAIYARFPLDQERGYRTFLSAMAAALLPVEAALDRAGAAQVVPDWPERRRSDLLRADLAQLGQQLPPEESPPPLSNEAEMLGAIYVLEGSRLGGAVLRKSVAPGRPNRFLSAPSPPGSWRSFNHLLDTRLTSPADLRQARATARQVFALFARSGLHALEPSLG